MAPKLKKLDDADKYTALKKNETKKGRKSLKKHNQQSLPQK